ncbi:MAG: hypothetical protein Q7T78_22145 [Rhodoferax sp.]|nr:hypothetical protein [Rhodoferax sp.]
MTLDLDFAHARRNVSIDPPRCAPESFSPVTSILKVYSPVATALPTATTISGDRAMLIFSAAVMVRLYANGTNNSYQDSKADSAWQLEAVPGVAFNAEVTVAALALDLRLVKCAVAKGFP